MGLTAWWQLEEHAVGGDFALVGFFIKVGGGYIATKTEKARFKARLSTSHPPEPRRRAHTFPPGHEAFWSASQIAIRQGTILPRCTGR